MKDKICTLTLNPAIDYTVFVDDFALNNVNLSHGNCRTPGSKGVNVARMLVRCGIPTTCFGVIGGIDGAYIENELKHEGVHCDFVPVDYNVRTNIKLIDLKNETYTDINFDGGSPSCGHIAKLREKTAILAKESKLIALAGSLPPEVSKDIYYELAMIAGEAGAKVSVDCHGVPLSRAIEAKPFIIKPNLHELETTFGIKCAKMGDVADAAMEIYHSGVENVLVSMGSRGALAVCAGDIFRVPVQDVKVMTTVGAGDAFLSGFIYGWHMGLDSVGCLRYAYSFSQVKVCMRPDAAFTGADLSVYADGAKIEAGYDKDDAVR